MWLLDIVVFTRDDNSDLVLPYFQDEVETKKQKTDKQSATPALSGGQHHQETASFPANLQHLSPPFLARILLKREFVCIFIYILYFCEYCNAGQYATVMFLGMKWCFEDFSIQTCHHQPTPCLTFITRLYHRLSTSHSAKCVFVVVRMRMQYLLADFNVFMPVLFC